MAEAGAATGLRGAVVTVGDELLLGHTVDTNAAWLGRALSELGVPLVRRFTVGDDRAAITEALEAALGIAQVVIFTGGLGPTRDDLTLEAVSGALGMELLEDPEILARLERRFLERGHASLPASNRSQARVPEGGEALPNPLGTAPGILIRRGEARVFLLPGVPREMKGLFRDQVEPRLREEAGGRLAPSTFRVIHTTGIAESALADLLEEALGPEPDLDGVSLAYLPDLTGVDLRLTLQGIRDPGEARARLDRAEARLDAVVRAHRFEAPSGDLVEAVGAVLRDRGLTLAVAESCTGGLLAKRLTDPPGASDYFLGGIVAYENGVKVSHLGVDPGVLEREGAVSRAVALAMARGVREALGASCGIGITGVAGPGGGTPEKPVGTVWFAAATPEGEGVRSDRFPGDRDMVRLRAAQSALILLFRLLRGEEAPDPDEALHHP